VRVGLDVSPLVRPHPRGLVRVVAETAAALERRGRLEVVRLAPGEGEDLRRWRRSALPRTARELDGIHSFVSAFPPGPGLRVQTIHELPWRHGVRENAGLRHRLWAALGPLRADAVCTATEVTARELRAGPPWRARKVRVIPWGVGAPFGPEPPPGEVDEVVLGTHRLPSDPLVLAPGAVRAKKRLGALLDGVAALHARGETRVHVIVTGEETADLRRDLAHATRLGIGRFVTTLEGVEDADLARMLRIGTAAAVLSASEGFGLPALEAIACGAPVLVPAGSAQAEVAGAGGIAVDARDPETVADGLERAVREREELRFACAEAARGRTWDATAERIEELWAELGERRR
jgi:glycosyltransferase involved in cell wall biosynthesis